jgi:streptogramin lyase
VRIRPKSLLPIVLAFLSLLAPTRASGQSVTEFSLPTAGSGPSRITAGPDGNLWFTEVNNFSLGRITTAGSVTEFRLPARADGITTGPDGNLWFTSASSYQIGRISPAGAITMFQALAMPHDITAGPDGNLWFTDGNGHQIGRMTATGVVTVFPTTNPPGSITAGPDGNLWFTESVLAGEGDSIGRITTSGMITEFPLPRESDPTDIATGPDDNLWFILENANVIGRITTSGIITTFLAPSDCLSDIAAGPDGNLWFTECSDIGRITTDGVISEFPLPAALYPPTGGSPSVGITAGPDGNIWFTEPAANKIGRLTVPRAPTLETRILPVVGSTPGVGGSFFRTSLQLHNPTAASISGRIVFHPSRVSGSGSDPALSYSLSPGQTQSIADLLPAMGLSGLGSADIEVTSGSIPTMTVRVFNDAGAAGTTGFTEEPMRAQDALRPGQLGVLLLPTDVTNFRFNLGVRTLEGGATATLTLRDASGAIVAAVPRGLPTTYHEQQSAAAFLGVSTLPAGGSIDIVVSAGTAIFYGASVDNRTGDPSFQIARGPWDY